MHISFCKHVDSEELIVKMWVKFIKKKKNATAQRERIKSYLPIWKVIAGDDILPSPPLE